ncbi:MAG: protein-disulfide reductase DsbD domain-containing protein, partial [Novosphingobium sp.]
MRCYRLLIAVLWQLCALLSATPAAQAAQTHIAAELVAESAGNPGDTVWLAFHMRPAPGWHGYWLNPGDAGLGMTLDWSLPTGAKAGEPRYPVPRTLLIAGLMNHVFEHEYAVLVPLTLPVDATPGSRIPAAVEAQWLACTDQICVPERARLATTIAVAPRGAPDPRFDRWRTRLPAPLGAQAHFARAGNTIRLGIPLPASLKLEQPHFFAAEDKLVDYAAPQRFSRKGDLLIEIKVETPTGLSVKQEELLREFARLEEEKPLKKAKNFFK